jgi:hypothetical protein
MYVVLFCCYLDYTSTVPHCQRIYQHSSYYSFFLSHVTSVTIKLNHYIYILYIVISCQHYV